MSLTLEQLAQEAMALPNDARAVLAGKLVGGNEYDLEQTFTELAERWRAETGMQSSVSKIVTHPAYLSIIGLGRPAVPLILNALKTRPEHWFVALRAIVRHSPVKPEDAGDLARMTEAWLEWGRQNQLVN
ncbi:MAG: hypothetical protein HYY24_18780 [Verrucomicrobia bacterium]|nr:hypothetical protein [Verrucomicrobiota bacterium]